MRKAISALSLALLAIGGLVTAAQADVMPDEVIVKYRSNLGFRTQSFV